MRLVRQAKAIPGRERRHVIVDTRQARLGSRARFLAVSSQNALSAGGFLGPHHASNVGAPKQIWESCPTSKVRNCLSSRASLPTKPERTSVRCWLRLPAGSEHHPRSAGGCTLYIKRSGLPVPEVGHDLKALWLTTPPRVRVASCWGSALPPR